MVFMLLIDMLLVMYVVDDGCEYCVQHVGLRDECCVSL